MLKTYLYIPDDLKEDWVEAVELANLSKAESVRLAIRDWTNKIKKQYTGSAESLLKLAEIGKKHRFKGPRDSSTRMDELLWDRDWSKEDE